QYLIQLYSYVQGQASLYTVTASGLGDTVPVLTGAERPDTAPLLEAGTSSVAGTLTGSTGGVVHYYRVNYAGNGTELRATLNFSPKYAFADNSIGVQLF